jgi:hypothetical protein
LLPGQYYLFDMNVPSDAPVKPRPNIKDGEVENFRVMGVEEVLVELSEGHFKPSSALAMAKFLIAHGHVTSESEPGFDLICAVLRGDNMNTSASYSSPIQLVPRGLPVEDAAPLAEALLVEAGVAQCRLNANVEERASRHLPSVHAVEESTKV